MRSRSPRSEARILASSRRQVRTHYLLCFVYSHSCTSSWKGVLLTGVYLPPNQLRGFLKLIRSSFIQAPHVTPPRTPRHSPPRHSPPPNEPPPVVQVSAWDVPIDSLVIDRCPPPTAPSDDPWTFNESDRAERQLHPPDANISSPPCMA
jgi:hypothetical protein